MQQRAGQIDIGSTVRTAAGSEALQTYERSPGGLNPFNGSTRRRSSSFFIFPDRHFCSAAGPRSLKHGSP
ncbi:hypothetical protein CRENBAI_003719 [Crenichthys baileyi]|uniref:Uncharacterized protein n=1 Tax=Crenichthys baileyi TaxID=28760 RepID=A0AAV9S1S0_9TELE